MINISKSRSKIFLSLFCGIYVLLSLKLLTLDSDVQLQADDTICCQEDNKTLRSDGTIVGKEDNKTSKYRRKLQSIFETLRYESESKSSCKMLMNEEVVSRALDYVNYGQDNPQVNSHNPDETGNKAGGGKKTKSCQPLGFSSVKLPVTALASFPGSGNTWVRHLLQEATGIYTGSVYKDKSLAKQFPGESNFDGSVIAVKIHETNKIDNGFFDRAIVVIRDPRDAMKAEYTRATVLGRHVGRIDIRKFRRKEWPHFVSKNKWDWFYSTLRWLSYPGPLHIVRYEDLITNLRTELIKMMNFLDIKVSDEILDCVVQNSEGSFHRKPSISSADPFDFIDKETIDVIQTLNGAIEATIVMRMERESL